MVATSARPLPHEELAALLRRAQAGESDAATAVYCHCRAPLLAVIESTMTRPLRRLEDADDFLIAAFHVIFSRHFTDEVLASPKTLWPYLKSIAKNKVLDAERRRRRRELKAVGLGCLAGEDEPRAREAPPDEETLFHELINVWLEDMIDGLPRLLQDILHRFMEGHSAVEIALRLGIDVKRVYRALALLERKVSETCTAHAV